MRYKKFTIIGIPIFVIFFYVLTQMIVPDFQFFADNQQLSQQGILNENHDNFETDYFQLKDFLSSPFSGRIIKEYPDNPAVMASIDNTEAARPQVGIKDAEIIYEFLVEGGITRLLALYWHQIPEHIGPIRSLRPYMIETGKNYDALLLHAGASPQGFNLLNRLEVNNLDQIYNGEYYFRSNRKVPHNLFTESKIKEYINNMRSPNYKPRFQFEFIDVLSTPLPAREVFIQFMGNIVFYEYDTSNNNYKRYLDIHEPHLIDDNQQVVVDNIIVKIVPTGFKDQMGRLKMDLTGQGEILVFKNGKVIEGYWKNDGNGWTNFLNEDEKEIHLNSGTTWIQVVPQDRVSINYDNDLDLR